MSKINNIENEITSVANWWQVFLSHQDEQTWTATHDKSEIYRLYQKQCVGQRAGTLLFWRTMAQMMNLSYPESSFEFPQKEVQFEGESYPDETGHSVTFPSLSVCTERSKRYNLDRERSAFLPTHELLRDD